jgi:hypothetical protein
MAVRLRLAQSVEHPLLMQAVEGHGALVVMVLQVPMLVPMAEVQWQISVAVAVEYELHPVEAADLVL